MKESHSKVASQAEVFEEEAELPDQRSAFESWWLERRELDLPLVPFGTYHLDAVEYPLPSEIHWDYALASDSKA
ncbi:hypothetical protein WJU23_10865 [Prosthecobacter sp. SYSU 5D2]|uniref:hypothetical protein n=1 Tax=Prosthecobacter sp. SYSU 5D2 TaxID=3134134 RepID=UPI0031FE4A1A